MNILLVEDDPGIGRFVSAGLTAEGYAVRWLRAGATVQATLAVEDFAVAILDLGLPDIDGAQLCADLRRDGIDTPVLMLTARDALQDRLEGFAAGADDYLAKPFAFEELLARLRVLVRRGGGAPTLDIGALRLDLKARAARLHGADLALPRREFEVLACLARQVGQPVSRQALIDQAWGETAEVADNTVDVYVGYLRRRLAAQAGAPVIETVRGLGFRLVAP